MPRAWVWGQTLTARLAATWLPERGRASARLAYNVLDALALLRGDVAHDILCILAGRRRVEIVDVALAFLAFGEQHGVGERRLDRRLQVGKPCRRHGGRHQ